MTIGHYLVANTFVLDARLHFRKLSFTFSIMMAIDECGIEQNLATAFNPVH